MTHLANWVVSVIVSLTASTHNTRLRSESESEMQARYLSIGEDLEKVVLGAPPLFADDQDRKKTSSLLLSIAFYESGFVKAVDNGKLRGDHGESYCLLQVRTGQGTVQYGPEEMRQWRGEDLIADRKKCIRAGLEALRISVQKCPAGANGESLNLYATGRCDIQSREARNRWRTAIWIGKQFPTPES